MPPAHLSRNFAATTVHLPWLDSLQIQHDKDENRDVEQKPDLLCSFKTQTCKMIEALKPVDVEASQQTLHSGLYAAE